MKSDMLRYGICADLSETEINGNYWTKDYKIPFIHLSLNCEDEACNTDP